MDPRRHHHHNLPPFATSSAVRFSSAPHHHHRSSPLPSPPPPPPLQPPAPPPHHRPREPYHHHYENEDRIPPYIPTYPQPREPPQLVYVPSNPNNPRVIFPDPFPRRIPRDLVDDADRVRVRAFPVRREAEPDVRQHQLITQGRIEVVTTRKRQRRVGRDGYVYLDDDDDAGAVEVVQGWSPGGHRKAVVWAGGRDAPPALIRRGDSLLQLQPSDVAPSVGLIPPERYLEPSSSSYVVDDEDRIVERDRVCVPGEEFQVLDDRQEYRERQFVQRSKSAVYGAGGSSSQDVSGTPRKRSVWQRLEEANSFPYSPRINSNSNNGHAIFPDRDRVDVPLDLDLSFKSNAFVAKEVSVSPSRDGMNVERRDAMTMERIVGKEATKDNLDIPISGVKHTGDGIPAKKHIIKPMASVMDTPAVQPEKKLKLAMGDLCSPVISTSKLGSNGEAIYSRPLKEEKLVTEAAEKPALKSIVKSKSPEPSSNVITKVSVPVPKQASPAKKVVPKSMILRKVSSDALSNHSATSNSQILSDEPKKKLEEKVSGSRSFVTSNDKKATTGREPKRRVVIRKRLVPRGSMVKKTVENATTEGTSAKMISSIVSDREVPNVDERKVNPPVSFSTSMPNVNENFSRKESSMKESIFESKITETVTRENVGHVLKCGYSSTGIENNCAQNQRERVSHEDIVSPRKNNMENDGCVVATVAHGMEIPEKMLTPQVIPVLHSSGKTATANRSAIANKQDSHDTAMFSLVSKPGTFTREDDQLSSKNAMLAGTLMGNLLDKTVTGSTVNKLPEDIVAGSSMDRIKEKPVAGISFNTAEEVVLPGNDMARTMGSDEISKESLLSQNAALCPIVTVNNALIIENQGKGKGSSGNFPNEFCSRVPSMIVKSCVAAASVVSTKDHMHLEGTPVVPRKRKRKYKKKITSSDVGSSPSTHQAEKTWNGDALGSFVNMPTLLEVSTTSESFIVHSVKQSQVSLKNEKPSKESRSVYMRKLDDAPRPLGFTLANGSHSLNQCILDSATFDIRHAKVIGTSSQSDLSREMQQKLSLNVTDDYSGINKPAASVSREDGIFGPFENLGVNDLVPGETVKGQKVLETQFPFDYHQAPVETVPFHAGHTSMGENEILQEQALLEVTPCLEREEPVASCLVSDNGKSSEVNLLPSTSDHVELIRNIDAGGKGNDMDVGRVDEKNHTVSGSMKQALQDDSKVQECLDLVPLNVQGFSSSVKSFKSAEGESGECGILTENELPSTINLCDQGFVDHSLVHMPFDCNRKEQKTAITKHVPDGSYRVECDAQIEQLQTVSDGGHRVGNSDDNSTKKLLSDLKMTSNLDSKRGVNLDKTLLAISVDHDKNMPSSLLDVKAQLVGSSRIVATEGIGMANDGQDHVKPRAFPQQTNHPIRQTARIAPGCNGRHRTWRRTDTSSVPQTPAHFRIPPTNSLHKQAPKKPERTQGSYVRKGNSLIRKSSEMMPPPQMLSVLGSNKTTSDSSNSRSLKIAAKNIDATDSEKTGKLPSTERSKETLLPLSPKQSCFTIIASKDPPDASQGNLAALPGGANLEPSILKSSSIPIVEQSKGNDLKRMVYVKHKSNQLVATKGSDTSNLPSLFNPNQAAPLTSSGLYYTRKNNKLIRDTPSVNLTKCDSLGSVCTSNAKREAALSRHSILKATFKGMNFKQSNFFVWTLNPVHPRGKDVKCPAQHCVLPYIFPWKRATHRRASLINYSKQQSLKLIRKLQISRKRDAVYTISKGGFALRKSGIRSIGGRSLKWSKSIERRAKKANEEATLAVAEIEKAKREEKMTSHGCATGSSRSKKCIAKQRIFRIGNVRYRMDSSKRTLIRIPDDNSSGNLESGQFDLKSIIPRRLVIDHDEYIRVGNGNQLVRDPKRLVRILASEKVRWSLHTARQRLAKKQQYCQFFTRYGKCKQEGKKCPYIHDPTKVAICTKFLKGLCSGTNCSLTHKIIPERMPDCSYFLRGHCTNVSCPYRHVNVNPRASVCEGFLKGYCGDGDECQKKHSYICPDFEATGKCFRGSDCKLHHPKPKNHSKKRKASDVKVHSKGRYFGSCMPGIFQPQILVPGTSTDDTNNGDIFSGGRMADYISLDAGSGNKSTDEKDLLPVHELDPGLFNVPAYDLDALIKPVRIMKRKRGGTNDVSTTIATAD